MECTGRESLGANEWFERRRSDVQQQERKVDALAVKIAGDPGVWHARRWGRDDVEKGRSRSARCAAREFRAQAVPDS